MLLIYHVYLQRLLNPGPVSENGVMCPLQNVIGYVNLIVFSSFQDCKSYYHECFLRGRPELTKLMQRLVNPGKRLPDKAGEPDFYEISRKYPLPAAPAPSQEDLQNAMGSPMGRGGGQAFSFQGAQAAGGYPYGYYQAGPYPQMPSPASGGYGGQPGFPPQPPQQSYWPNQMGQMPPGMYPPNPAAAYGYYPYPQMMAAPQGYEQSPPPPMYRQYGGYPGAPSPFNQPGASPGRAGAKPSADAQAAQQLDKQTGQYPYPPEAVPAVAAEGAAADERKPPAQTAGVKRDLEESQEGQAATEGQTEAGEASKSAQEGAAAQQGGSTESADPAGSAASAKGAAASSEGGSGNAPAPGSSPKKGDGINEQQLLQDFFQHF